MTEPIPPHIVAWRDQADAEAEEWLTNFAAYLYTSLLNAHASVHHAQEGNLLRSEELRAASRECNRQAADLALQKLQERPMVLAMVVQHLMEAEFARDLAKHDGDWMQVAADMGILGNLLT